MPEMHKTSDFDYHILPSYYSTEGRLYTILTGSSRYCEPFRDFFHQILKVYALKAIFLQMTSFWLLCKVNALPTKGGARQLE